MRPHRRQPTRLRHPWDSPGKDTGVGCHFLLQFMKVKTEREVAQSCLTLLDPIDCSLPGSSIHGIFQASTGVGCHCLLHTDYTPLQMIAHLTWDGSSNWDREMEFFFFVFLPLSLKWDLKKPFFLHHSPTLEWWGYLEGAALCFQLSLLLLEE